MDYEDYLVKKAYYSTVFGVSFTAAYLVFTRLPAIVNYAIDSLMYSPGEGKIYSVMNPLTKRKQVYIKTPGDHFRLNFIKTPSLDMSVHLFKNNIELDADKLMTRDVFNGLYKFYPAITLTEHSLGIIDDVYHTRNIKRGDVYGYISSITEDMIFVFKIREGAINFEDIFERYEFVLEEFENI